METRTSNLLAGTGCYLIASVFWGMNIPMTAELLATFDPFWLSPVRYVIASTLLGAWVAATLGARRLRPPIALARVALLGLAVAFFLACFNVGLQHTHPVTAAAVLAGSPVWFALVAKVMTGAPLARGFVGATVLTIAGSAVAIAGRADADGLAVSGGEVLMVVSLASWAVYSILAQRWFAADVPQLGRTFLSSVGALPWLLAFWIGARALGWAGEPMLRPSGSALAYLVVTAVCGTALATVAWNVGVSRLGITAGAMWQNAVPVFAVAIAAAFFGVVPAGTQVLGGAIVLAGVLYMQWHVLRDARRAAPAAGGRAAAG